MTRSSKTLRYWPGADISIRKQKLIGEFERILNALKREFHGVALEIPSFDEVASLASLERYEDCIDALICAWVGVKYLNREAVPYGYETAAIWAPETGA